MRKIMIPVMIALVIILIGAGVYSINKPKHEMSYPLFLEAVRENRVSKVTMNEEGNSFDAYLIDESDIKYTVPNPKTDNFTEFLLINNIDLSYQNNSLSDIAGLILVAIIAIGIIYYTRAGGQAKT